MSLDQCHGGAQHGGTPGAKPAVVCGQGCPTPALAGARGGPAVVGSRWAVGGHSKAPGPLGEIISFSREVLPLSLTNGKAAKIIPSQVKHQGALAMHRN